MIVLKLAEIPLLFDQLDMMVLAEELPLVRDVIRRADGASSMAALEAALVVHGVIDSNPLNWIDCLVASNTFLSGASKCARDFNSILPRIHSFSTFLSGLTTFGVPSKLLSKLPVLLNS